MLRLKNWYLGGDIKLFLGGMLEGETNKHIYEPVLRVSYLSSCGDYVIETEVNLYRCTLAQENSSLHCEKGKAQLEKLLRSGIGCVNNAKRLSSLKDDYHIIARNLLTELSPEIVQDIRNAGEVSVEAEENLRLFIRVTGLFYGMSSVAEDAETSVYEELKAFILN